MRAWWFALIAVGAAALGGAGWYLTSARHASVAPGDAAAEAVTADPRQASRLLGDELATAKEYTPFFDALKTNFQSDYAKEFAAFVARARTSGRLDSPDVYFNESYRNLRQTRGVNAARASPQAMARVFDAQSALLKAMGDTDPHLCVDAIYGGATTAYFLFAAAHRNLVAELGNASLAAILEGQAVKIEPAIASDADVQAFEQALAGRGLSEAEIAVLTAGAPPPALPDSRMCELGQIKQAVISALPLDMRWRMFRLALELAAQSG